MPTQPQLRAGDLLLRALVADDASFAITLAQSAELVGAISLMHIDAGEAGAELGCWVGVPWWGQGIATCAARALLEFGFSHMQLQRVHARCLARNPASGKVLLRAGFSHMKTEDSICGYQGENQATDFFECLTPWK